MTHQAKNQGNLVGSRWKPGSQAPPLPLSQSPWSPYSSFPCHFPGTPQASPHCLFLGCQQLPPCWFPPTSVLDPLTHPPSRTQRDQIITLLTTFRDILLQEQNLDSASHEYIPCSLCFSHTGPISPAATGPLRLFSPLCRTLLYFAPLPLDYSSAPASLVQRNASSPSALLELCYFPSQHIFHFVIRHLNWSPVTSPPPNRKLQEGWDHIRIAFRGALGASIMPSSQ